MSKPEDRRTIVLTGGGTAGHVMPNLALLPALKKAGFDVHYIGSNGIEKDLVEKANIPFHVIATGKLRRYFSIQNFLDIFRIFKGIFDALVTMREIQPQIVFSKGGFVAVPVALAARFLGVPVISHESDYSPGLANRIIAPFARRILYTFEETGAYLPANRSVLVGSPVRGELFEGRRQRGFEVTGFSKKGPPVLLVMGGSQGAQRLNQALLEILPRVVTKFRVVHLTGKGKSINFSHSHYRPFEFLGAELSDVFSICDLVVCRAGANSIFEMLALQKPMLLVPLQVGSRGDQVLNARSFQKRGWANILMEMDMTPETLEIAIEELYAQSSTIISNQKQESAGRTQDKIVEILLNEAKNIAR